MTAAKGVMGKEGQTPAKTRGGKRRICEQKVAPSWVQALLDTTLTPVECRIAMYLVWRQGGNNYAWPSQDTIATELGLTAEGVRKITKRLEAKGWLCIERPELGGRGRRIHYTITPPEPPTVVGPSSIDKPPTAVQGLDRETPNSRTKKPPTAVPRHIRRTHKGTHTTSEPAFRLSELLFDCIQNRKLDFRKPDLSKWAVHVDRMIRIDHRKPDRIEAVIRWVQSDTKPRAGGFCWANNILSTAALREKFDRLEMDMETKTKSETHEPLALVRDGDGLTPRQRLLAGSAAL